MPPLLRKPFGRLGKVHEITAASAGWRYVGFSLCGFEMHYLDVMAGSLRKWRFVPNPNAEWIKKRAA